MSGTNKAMDVYLTGLRNQHAVETQAIGTVKNELSRMEPYPELHAKMQEEMQRSETQAARLDDLLGKHGTSFKAYEIASYKVLLTLADAAGATADKAVLEQSMKEEQEMGDWLGTHLPGFVQAFLAQQAK